jgi:thiosulfate/3-mercaptopyruvate sulfurtransferase
VTIAGDSPKGGDDILVSPAALRDLLEGEAPPALLDVRWALGDPAGHDHYLEAHLPSAVYVDLDTELARPPGSGTGRHPLPNPEDLQSAARGWGLRAGQPVVVYDDNGGLSAARAWWLLGWAGISVRLLDGGLSAWKRAGYPVVSGEQVSAPGDVVVVGGQLPVLTADEAGELARVGTLLDARAPERYRGEQEPIDPRAGHIPGALSAPTGENLTADGTFGAPDALRARFEALGLSSERPIGVYCGSGVTAAHEIAALRLAGIDAALFPGSWSAWSADPGRPAATGPEPG